MPYIKQEDREKIKEFIDFERIFTQFELFQVTPGDLNYIITEILHCYLDAKKESYQTYNDMIGAVECAKIELYRRRIQIYEDQKIKLNGDV